MLEAQTVSNVLEHYVGSTDMLAFAVLNQDGVVLESRESQSKEIGLFPQCPDHEDDFHVSSKLQTKIYGLFAAECWSQCRDSQWLGAEAHGRRLVVWPLKDEDLLLLTVAANTKSWGLISKCAKEAADQLSKSL